MIQWIPAGTTLFSIYFFMKMYAHYRRRSKAPYIFWWMIGVLCYGAGTTVETLHSIFGWNEINFKAWYITGALLGGWPLATGSVYLLFRKSTADKMTLAGMVVIAIAALLTILSPIRTELVNVHKLSGKVLAWHFIRYITPFINLYAFIFLVGGAAYSALQYARSVGYKTRFIGNLLIAIGGLLPGIGGTYSKFGMTEVLYVTEFLGLLFIYAGYHMMKTDKSLSVHSNQQHVGIA